MGVATCETLVPSTLHMHLQPKAGQDMKGEKQVVDGHLPNVAQRPPAPCEAEQQAAPWRHDSP